MPPRVALSSQASPDGMCAITVQKIYTILKQHNALIVHFSTLGKSGVPGNGNHPYPADLKHVIENPTRQCVACSTVNPNDTFDGDEANATGCIGVVLGLTHDESVKAARPSDMGSILRGDGVRDVEAKVIHISEIERSIAERNENNYNEWSVESYYVIGILAVDPLLATILGIPNYPPDVPDYLRDHRPQYMQQRFTLREVHDEFSGKRIFTFKDGRICEFRDNEILEVRHGDIYVESVAE
jgi:hypothetical protein